MGLIAVTDVQESRAAHDNATRRRHRRETRAGDRAGSAARTDRQELPGAGEAGRPDAARQAGPARRAGLGRPRAAEQPRRGRRAARYRSRERATSRSRKPATCRRSICSPSATRFDSRRDADQPSTRRHLARPTPRARRRTRSACRLIVPDLQRRRDAIARARAGAPAPRGPREARRHDAFGRARDARRLPRRASPKRHACRRCSRP